MKALHHLTDEHFIQIAKIIDNEFRKSLKKVVERKGEFVYVKCYTEGGQCISGEVKLHICQNIFKGIFIQNDDEDSPGAFKHVYPPTIKRILYYLYENGFEYVKKEQ